ncbi:4Fe-4S binding protein, partial [candidate division KSB1 bacterium]
MKKTRYLIQFLFLALIIFLVVQHQFYRGAGNTAPICSYCPFGGIETAYSYITSGTFLYRVSYSNFILILSLLAMGIVLKSGFCGWICPFGTVQEWIGNIGKIFFGKRRVIPEKVDKYALYIKYAVFLVVIIS